MGRESSNPVREEDGILEMIGRVVFLLPPSPLRDTGLPQASCLGTLKTLIPYRGGLGEAEPQPWESGSLSSCLGGTTCHHRMLGLREFQWPV